MLFGGAHKEVDGSETNGTFGHSETFERMLHYTNYDYETMKCFQKRGRNSNNLYPFPTVKNATVLIAIRRGSYTRKGHPSSHSPSHPVS